VAVMYAGRVRECGPAEQVLLDPQHPYTVGLLRSVPRADPTGRPLPLTPIPPGPVGRSGCAFAPRCAWRRPDCDSGSPPLREGGPGRVVRCLLPGPPSALTRRTGPGHDPATVTENARA
jgi:oligopeptide/dipeptide ABC transporter ATP-binding protein